MENKAMRKMILGILFLGLLASCKKNNLPSVSSGSWTFQSVTYKDANGVFTTWGNSIVSIVATANRNSNTYLVVSNDSTQTFMTGIYSLGSGPNTSTTKYLGVEVTDSSGNPYIAVANSGNISVDANNDSITLSTTGIKMINYNLTDTSILTFNITQTY